MIAPENGTRALVPEEDCARKRPDAFAKAFDRTGLIIKSEVRDGLTQGHEGASLEIR
jgi:hypothetical protein